jgi:phage shock protein PspC (stress-responsive transcriptional regulator)/predicted membrane protein
MLRRDRANRVLGGVAAGIARTYGIDVTLVRVLWIIAAIAWIGIPAYVVAWIAIPPDDGSSTEERPRDIGLLVGLALVGAGALIAANHLVPQSLRMGGRFIGPLFLIAGGVAILVLRRPGRPNGQEPTRAGDAAPATAAAGATSAAAPATTLAAATTTTTVPGTPLPESPTQQTPGVPVAEPVSAWTQTAPWPTIRDARRLQRRERRSRRPRPFLTPLTLSVLLVAAGVTSFLQAIEVIEVNVTLAIAIATCAVGAVLVLSAWVGRARGLILLGLLLVVATAVSSTIDVPLRGGIGEDRYRPAHVADVLAKYELAIGHMSLDLRDVAPGPGETLDVNASVGIGRLQVNVPSSARVEVDAHTGAGSILLFGRHDDGWHRDVIRSVDGDPGAGGVLHLKLRVGAGEIDVHRFQPGGIETLIGVSG